MANPLVSVVVPVFNGERFLDPCLASIFAQDYDPFEVIVVDDESYDRTAEVARSFAGVRYIYQTNQGVSAARNTGVAAAAGQLISFIDGDDRMVPTKLSAQVSHLLANPDVDCVLGRHVLALEPGVEAPAWLRRDSTYGDLDGVQAMSAVVRRRWLTEVQFNPAYRFAEDVDWLLRLRSAGANIAVLPEIVFHRRLHGANQTMTEGPDFHSFLRIIRDRVHHNRAAQPQEEPS